MTLQELMYELECCPDEEVFVEVNSVVHRIHEVQDTSQGIILVSDPDQEERELR
jgi:hypothetical protein